LLPKIGDVHLPPAILQWLNGGSSRPASKTTSPGASAGGDGEFETGPDGHHHVDQSAQHSHSQQQHSAQEGRREDSDPDFVVMRKQTSGGECLTFVTQLPAPAPQAVAAGLSSSMHPHPASDHTHAPDLDSGSGGPAGPAVLVLLGGGSSMGQADVWVARVLSRALVELPLRVLWSVKQELRALLGQAVPARWRVKVR